MPGNDTRKPRKGATEPVAKGRRGRAKAGAAADPAVPDIPVTNTSVNPARSIGPALFAGGGAFAQLWLFLVTPCIGSAIAAFAYTALRPVDPDAQVTMRAATQALPTEQEQRVDSALANPPVRPRT